jgi:RNA polymerase sigma factor (sigma-70 family)
MNARDVTSTSRTSDDGLPAFVSARSRLFGIACRMLGSAAEAEDIVQDVWLRWQTADRDAVRDPRAFLVTTTTRLALNHAQSARIRREEYVGSSLPEPLDDVDRTPLGAEHGEALGFAVLILMEKLTPKERAAYILREAFNYAYVEIAATLQVTEPCCRQLVTRARKRIAEGHRAPVTASQRRRLLDAFTQASRRGDLAALEGVLLATDVGRLRALDSGPRVPVSVAPQAD